MTDRLANLIQWASIVIGITGMSLDKLIPLDPSISYILIALALAAFIVLVVIQVMARDLNHFKGKQEVDGVWNRVLMGADSSVRVFAGDVSWGRKNQDALEIRHQNGVDLRVICRWPTTPILRDQVRALFAAGVKVRFYSSDIVKIRALVIDADSSIESRSALTVVKTAKKVLDAKTPGQPGTDQQSNYSARRYVSASDNDYITTLHQLFDSVWETLPAGLILERVSLNPEVLCNFLRVLKHYEMLTPANVTLRTLSLAALHSCCRTVKAPKLARTTALLSGFKQFKLDPFESCRLEHEETRTLLLPPIVEEQADGRLVVIDGMHRLHQLSTHTDAQEALCLVITGAGPLSSDPIPFREVRVSPVKLPRAENFPNYRHEYFRDIKALYRHLATVVDQYATPAVPSKG
jgi:hypothetical protein